MSGTYDIDLDSCMQINGSDQERKIVKFTTLLYAEDREYLTQMIVIGRREEKSLYIWKSKEQLRWPLVTAK
jgi:hypothetical protein